MLKLKKKKEYFSFMDYLFFVQVCGKHNGITKDSTNNHTLTILNN